jgi:lipopolysaccharide export LptBFGC system permease protein LptF
MMKKIAVLLVLVGILFAVGCGTAPTGLEDAKAAAYQAKSEADAVNASEYLPMEYEAADSVLQTAESEESAGNMEEALNLYQEAETKFDVVTVQTKKKMDVDTYMVDTAGFLDRLETKIDEVEE